MGQDIYFNAAAFGLALVFGFSFYLRENDRSVLNKILLALLVCNLCSLTAALLCEYFPYGVLDLPILNHILTYIHYLAHNLTHSCICVYVLMLAQKKNFKREIFQLICVILFIVLLLLASNPFTKFLFVFSGGVCQVQWGMSVLYFAMEIIMAVILMRTWEVRQSMPHKQWMEVLICMLAQMLGILIEMLVPQMYIESLLMTAGIVVLGASAKNTKHIINYETKVLSSSTFQFRFEQKRLLGQPFCVILLYCKDWQFYTDAFGFETGEFLLRSIARYLRKLFTEEDVFYFGNQVFGMIFTDYDHYGYQKYITQMRRQFEKPWEVQGYHIRIDACFVGLRYLDDFQNYQDIFECAHGLRNTAQRTDLAVLGKNQLVMKDLERMYRIKALLHKAVREDGFDVFYQPIYSTHSHNIVSAEALVRLKDTKTLGFVSPEEFIPIAEQTGLIIPLGEIVFEKVCRFMKEQKVEEHGIEYIEVNLSTIQCMEEDLMYKITDILKKYGIRPEQINLEITETAKINSMEYVRTNMNYLKQRRLSFSLDDYGSGNANLNYLLEFDFDIAKIDKFVLWNAFQNPKYMETLECTIQMLKQLGVRMVMEGVETEEQKKKLEDLECDYFQGYYFSRPLPPTQFMEYLVSFGQGSL